MSQQTLVFSVPPLAAANLEQTLRAALPGDAEWRPVPYARFSVKAEGVVFTCYRSGKVVVQGPDPQAFVERHLPRLAGTEAIAGGIAPDTLPIEAPTVGSDEVGKGDYFGPLVVAAVLVLPNQREALTRIGVADSKSLSDERMKQMVGPLETLLPHHIVVLDPERYNERYTLTPNVNTLLADLHVECLAPLLRAHPDAIAVVDRFTSESLLAGRLAAARPAIPELGRRLKQIVRGERHPAVAAASVLARIAFLEGMQRCSDTCATDLHKGAGSQVDADAIVVHQIGGLDLLRKVAKLHFKNTQKIPGLQQ